VVSADPERQCHFTEGDTMTKTKLTLLAASLAVATGLFWARMLVAPPTSEAAITSSVPVEQLTLNARNLPQFEATYQMHTGVLDTLKAVP
jgi:hypothetical protein